MISLLAAESALLCVGRRVCGRVRRDLGLSARQHLLRHDESDGAVQRDLAVSHILARRHGRLIPASWDPRLIGPALAPDHAHFISPVQRPIATVAHQALNQEWAFPQLLAGAVVMISHCASPRCTLPFHYLRGGRLYRFDITSPSRPCADVPNAVCTLTPSRATVFSGYVTSAPRSTLSDSTFIVGSASKSKRK